LTVPPPEPLAPLVIVTQLTPLAAVHGQPARAPTATEPVELVPGTDALVGERV
jgi:hypothetical protein